MWHRVCAVCATWLLQGGYDKSPYSPKDPAVDLVHNDRVHEHGQERQGAAHGHSPVGGVRKAKEIIPAHTSMNRQQHEWQGTLVLQECYSYCTVYSFRHHCMLTYSQLNVSVIK